MMVAYPAHKKRLKISTKQLSQMNLGELDVWTVHLGDWVVVHRPSELWDPSVNEMMDYIWENAVKGTYEYKEIYERGLVVVWIFNDAAARIEFKLRFGY